MQKLPTVVGLKICHDAIVQETTRNVTLVNCFRKLRNSEFPTEPIDFTACIVVADGFGEGRLTLTITALDDLTDIAAREWEIELKDPLREVWYLLPIAGVVFPHPGKYEIGVAIDDERIAQTAVQVTPKEE